MHVVAILSGISVIENACSMHTIHRETRGGNSLSAGNERLGLGKHSIGETCIIVTCNSVGC